MNKSKFLKKSLAAVLAVLMVVAMIPLSAAAASTGYKPTGLKITGPNGEVATPTAEKNKYELNLKWDSAAPTITISTETAADEMWAVVGKVDGSGNPVGSEPAQMDSGNNPATGNLEMEDDGTPIPFRFFVKNSGEQSDDITVTWTRESASTSGRATKATLNGQFNGEINDNAKTITFTVPFGYTTTTKCVIEYTGCADASKEETSFTGLVVGTNQKRPVGVKVFNETQEGKTPVEYEIIIKQETGLTEFKVGDLKTEIEIATADAAGYDKGMETGNIKVYVPSTLEPVSGKLELIPTFKISDPSAKITINDGTGDIAVTSGKKFDFSKAYSNTNPGSASAAACNPAGVDVKVTSTKLDGTDKTRDYTLVFVRWEDVELTGVTAVDYNNNGTKRWQTVDGTVSGSEIEVVVPKNAQLDDFNLTFTGPRNFNVTGAFTSAAGVVVKGGNNGTDTSKQAFNTSGTHTTAVNIKNYTKPLPVVVTSDDGKHQKVYTLTVKAIDEDSVAPAITSGVLVLNKGTSDETPYNASISGTTITFTVPHSADDTVIGNGVYTWVRNSKATTLYFGTTAGVDVAVPNNGNVKKPDTFKDGGSVAIVSASGNAVKYQIKFARLPAETGKVISDMRLTTAPNVNEIGYNNNKTYNVTLGSNKFTVTVPDADDTYITGKNPGELYADFKLSKGAKLYKYNVTSGAVDTTSDVTHANDDGVNAATGLVDIDDTNTAYFVADETLATMIRDGDAKITQNHNIDWKTINREFGSHKVDYKFDVKEAPSNNTLIVDGSITDRNGFITSKIEGLKDHRTITLTVPSSYVLANGASASDITAKTFALNYKTNNNAVASLYSEVGGSNWDFPLYPNGKQTYNTTSKKLVPDSLTDLVQNGNTGFYIQKDANGKAFLHVTDGSGVYTVLPTGTAIGAGYYELRVTAENGDTEDYTVKEIKVADAEQGAQITELTVNGKKADIDQNKKAITAYVDYGTNLGQIDIALKASKMALVSMEKATNDGTTVAAGTDYYDKDVAGTYDLRYPMKITVKSESDTPRVTNTYTLTVKTGEQFTDVPANAWFAPYVKEAVEKGIVTGRGDNTFGPYDDITRQDFALMTVRMLGLEDTIDKDATVPFTDASSVSDYAKAAVAYCAKEGIIGGYEDQTFRPQGKITREEAAKILAEALELNVTGTPTFVDTNKISSWARSYVAAVQTAKIFNGDEAKRFNGTTRITRAETAKVMVESLKIK